MAEQRPTNPLVDQFRKTSVPRDLRLMAAQGALPLKPADLVELLLDLRKDPDAEVAETAKKSLAAQKVDELVPIAKDKFTPPPVLAWILDDRQEKQIQEVVLQNTNLAVEAIEARVAALSEPLAELVVINQVRLLRRTSLLEALEKNPNLSNDQKRRLREPVDGHRLAGPLGIGGQVEELLSQRRAHVQPAVLDREDHEAGLQVAVAHGGGIAIVNIETGEVTNAAVGPVDRVTVGPASDGKTMFAYGLVDRVARRLRRQPNADLDPVRMGTQNIGRGRFRGQRSPVRSASAGRR